MFEKLERNYKDDSAENTIHRIRNLLKDVGLFTYEYSWSNPFNEVYSVSISLDEKHGQGTTHGKGRSPSYALASAYGEFMERIQNSTIEQFSAKAFSERVYKHHGFMYHPDERMITDAEFEKVMEKIMNDNFHQDNLRKAKYQELAIMYKTSFKYNESNLIAVPFFDTKNNSTLYIPFRFIYNHCLGNGMCAGNTPEEAICQGLNEIMERDAGKKIYFGRLTPPIVSKDYLKNFPSEYSMIEDIESDGIFEVVVKDFSANQGYPVIGVIIKNLKENIYLLSIGCDSAFQVALSRAITECYQGYIFEHFKGHPIPEEEYSFFINNDEKSLFLRAQNLYRFYRNHQGLFPKALFDKKEDYSFNSNIFKPGKNYISELKRTVKLFHERGKNVYIRDTSFLGFPSYYVFIPDTSWIFDDVASMYAYYYKEELPDLKRLIRSDDINVITSLAQKLESSRGEQNILQDVFHLKFKNKSQMSYLFDIPFMLSCIWYRLEDFEKSSKQIDRFLKEDTKRTKFNLAFQKYLNMKADGGLHEKIIGYLKVEGYSERIIKDVSELLHDPKRLFMNFKFPDCPRCEYCKLASDCITKNSLVTIDKVYSSMKKKKICQNDLVKLFD